MRSDATRACVLALAALLAGRSAPAQPAFEQLRIIAPAAPGGGWDQTARAMQLALQRAGIVATPVVENVPGAAGTIGLARFIGAERGDGEALLVSGLIMLGGIVTHRSPVTLADVVPIARLTGEYEVLAVPAMSPFQTLDDLLRAPSGLHGIGCARVRRCLRRSTEPPVGTFPITVILNWPSLMRN